MEPTKRRRGRPANPNFPAPQNLAEARALLAAVLVRPSVTARYLSAVQRLLKSFEAAEARSDEIKNRRDELTAAKAEIERLKALIPAPLSEEDELTRKALAMLAAPAVTPKPVEPVTPMAKSVQPEKPATLTPAHDSIVENEMDYDAEIARLDAESKQLELEIERRKQELI